ncbi:MFS transporter [Streptomyces marianii]|uniref:MFS transporter n=1 Tax=Streptomyces marianii TaxID=1817406 RepID=A0A5R9E5U2_9ACTN|nr:MFS transporter [Streptomyces marianii]TLQ45361.1 MFS transporter [Streptomyces marianii]
MTVARTRTASATGPRGRRRLQRLTLTSSITGAVVVAVDGSVLAVVQPVMQRELRASFTEVQWTSTGYLIAVASLLVFAGRLGDRLGHRRVFTLGALGFAVASAGIGLSGSVGLVIGLRVLQGVFGALLQPATLGMLRAAYPPDRLAMPIALRTSAIGLAVAAGPLVGGTLAVQLGWRSVFFLSVVPALAVALLVLLVRAPEVGGPDEGSARTGASEAGSPEAESAQAGASQVRTTQQGHADAARGALGLPGALLFALCLGSVVHALVELPGTGWTASVTLAAFAAAGAGAAFVVHERRTASPLVPPGVLRSVPLVASLAVLVSASAALCGTLFLGMYLLQHVLGLDPFASALRMLPLAAVMVLGAPATALLQRRFGHRRTAVSGMALLALGVLLTSRLDAESSPVATGLSFLVVGAGFCPVMVTATAVVVREAPLGAEGVSGGLQQTAMNIGPALGVALVTMLMGATAPGAGRGPAGGADFTAVMGNALVALAAWATLGALVATRLPSGANCRR